MRVLLVTNDYPPKPGGIQQYLGNIVDHTAHDIRVLAPLDERALSDRRVVRHPSRRFMWPTPKVQRWIEAEARTFAAEVMVFGAPTPLASAGPRLAERLRIPHVVMTHGAELTIPMAFPGARGLVARPLRSAAAVFAVSRYTAERVSAATGRRDVVVLGAGVDVDRFHPAPRLASPPTVGVVSRFVPRKGHAKVLEAVNRLRAAGHGIDVLMVGTGRLEQDLRALATRLEVPTRFEVDVPWDRLPDLYREMTVFAMPATSRWWGLEIEGLGIVYLEAAASGLPVIAGPSGGAPETVVPGETGLVAGTVDGIVAALEEILADPAAMGTAGRRWVESRWSWRHVADRFDATLSDL